MLEEYTIDELEYEISTRKYKEQLNGTYWETVEQSLEEAVKDIPTDQWIRSLRVEYKDGRNTLYAGDTKITLAIKGNKVIPSIMTLQLKGAKRTAVFKKIMEYSKTLTSYKSFGKESPIYSNDQTVFQVYTVHWNKIKYNIGFIHTENWENEITSAYSHANYMMKFSEYNKPKEEDISYSHTIAPIHSSSDYDDPIYIEEQITYHEKELERWESILKDFINPNRRKD